MRNTENYELNMPETTDFYNVEDFNENMEILDSKIKEIEDEEKRLKTDSEGHTTDKENPHNVTKEQVGLGNVQNKSTNNQTPTYSVKTELAELTSGEKLGEAFGKIAMAVSSLISHLANEANPHSVSKSQIGLGNVPNVATNNQTPTYNVATALTTLVSGEKLSVSMGKIAKAITDLINHLANKENPHAVTKEQVGLGNVNNSLPKLRESLIVTESTKVTANVEANSQAVIALTAPVLSGYRFFPMQFYMASTTNVVVQSMGPETMRVWNNTNSAKDIEYSIRWIGIRSS